MMNFYKSILFGSALFFFSACQVISQQTNKIVQINEIKIYNDFKLRGYTTAGMYTNFDDLRNEQVQQIVISQEDKHKMEKILSTAEKKKHHQTKFGGNLLFCEMRFKDESQWNRVVITDAGIVYNLLGKPKEKRAFITDLTYMINYKITDKEDLQWLSKFIEQVKQQEKKH